ncbi:MAG: hypothetical protein LBG06_10415 [Deltaproteobacteria bacterium]|jgi:uncharacterized small protein (DUF1192 family)|nr:hypothetical protein [Deltaproteobacteria bacterium]
MAPSPSFRTGRVPPELRKEGKPVSEQDQDQDIREGQQGPGTPPPLGFYTAFEMELSRRVSENEKAMALLAAGQERFATRGDVEAIVKAAVAELTERIRDTKAEIADTKAELTERIADTKAELTERIADTKAELTGRIADTKAEIADTKAELAGRIADTKDSLRAEIGSVEKRLSQLTAVFGIVSAVFAALLIAVAVKAFS